MGELSKKVAIVTGGGGDIGTAVSRRLAREGASVMVVDIVPERAKNTVEEIEAKGGNAIVAVIDVTKTEDVQNMVKRTVEQFGTVDLLLNVAGIDVIGKVVELPEEDWDRCMNINVRSMFLCCKYTVPYMIKKRWGKIVNMASAAGKRGVPYMTAYCASKHAVIGFTRSLAMELAQYNINVNAVCPGAIYTRPWQHNWKLWQKLGDELSLESNSARDYYDKLVEKVVPLKRGQTVEDIANIYYFLVSERSKNITGQAINVTGGTEFH